MAAVLFRLRHNGKSKTGQFKTEPVAIQVYYYHEGISVELSTGIKVLPENWNGTRVTGTLQAKKINKVLSELETALFNVHIEHRNKSKEQHESIIREIIKGEAPSQKKTVETWIETFIKESKVKDSTKQVYNSSFTHLKEYAAEKKLAITWEMFDLDFYESFTSYLYRIGLNDNTVGKVIKTLKTFISQAFERDLHQNLNFKKKGFKVINTEVDEIYLDESEIIRIHNLNFQDPELQQSKKRFVFDCWVGLRFGDMSRINPNQITKSLTGGLMLKVTTEKTGEDVMIPLHPLAEEIWHSWGGIPPAEIHNSEFNDHLKTIAKEAKIDTIVQKRNTIKSKVTIEWVPKHTMVKAHTARRSFATNCYLMGIPSRTIMAVTGHKTEKAFLKYIRVTKEQHANIMAGFFNKPKEESIMKKAN